MSKQEKLENIALVGNSDSYGYKIISLLDALDEIKIKKYSPRDIEELFFVKNDLTKNIKYKCIFICTSIFSSENNSNENQKIDFPLGLTLLKTIRTEDSINKDSMIVIIGEQNDQRYRKKAEKYGADKYIF